jgi:4-hydroxy-tetrahydrodipicolinate synthase
MQFAGSICALVTPFTQTGDIDYVALPRLLDWHIQSGTKALVIAGSTGESTALTESELANLWRFCVQHVAARISLIAGTGTPSTYKSLALTALAREIGMQAALVVAPAYVRPTQEGLYKHYLTLADAGTLPIILYNVPTRTACDLLPATVARLHEHPNIVGIKEALADRSRMAELLLLQNARFSVLSGDDATALRSIRDGARGVISVAANVVPAIFSTLCDLALAGSASANQIDLTLQPLYAALGLESNPIPVKWALAEMGRIHPGLRLPLTTLSVEHHSSLREVLVQLDLHSARAAA